MRNASISFCENLLNIKVRIAPAIGNIIGKKARYSYICSQFRILMALASDIGLCILKAENAIVISQNDYTLSSFNYFIMPYAICGSGFSETRRNNHSIYF